MFPPSSFQSRNQIGIATFGPNHLKTLVLEAMHRALKAVWYQKWSVHRRLRPEAFGGRVHFSLSQPANPLTQYPFHATEFAKLGSTTVANSILDRIFRHNQALNAGQPAPQDVGTYLLPMAYAEGSPLHPSYGQGHATAAGAGVTILKAFFANLTFGQLNAEVCEVDASGQRRNYNGPGASTILNTTTVHGELNKLAANIGQGRNFAGVHYRSDSTNSLYLGEQVAINLLEDYYSTVNEPFRIEFMKFDGQPYTLTKSESGPDLDRS